MISIKGGTKTFSDAQPDNLRGKVAEQGLSAADKEKFFGGQDLGAVLNKVADPNWVDPAKKMRTVGNSQMDKDAFLKLLLTQLKNQDPTSPMESHEMAAQLAQFTSLEKLTNIDSGIKSLTQAQKPEANFDALNLIGKAIQVDGSKILRNEETDIHDIKFNLSGSPVSTEVKIKNAAGQLVRKLEYSNLKEGQNEISWNGMLEDGTKAPKGDYRVEISAKSSNGKNLMAEMKQAGVISGVKFSAAGPVLLLGNKEVAMSDVKSITDPRLLSAAAPAQAIAKESNPIDPSKTVKPQAGKKEVIMPGGLDGVSMSRGIQQKLEKDGIDVGL
ncbi:MAG: flagellar biosynthesis protein FlgD [Bdellovibrionales bacterium]|nr:flagellar biosynthesis protein FlgD [Bdellovibrionales bacterium]